MAKVFSPALSIAATGKIGKAIAFQKRPSGFAMMKNPAPNRHSLDNPTAAQQIQRAAIASLVAQWQSLSVAEKEYWDNLAKESGNNLSGYHEFMRVMRVKVSVCGDTITFDYKGSPVTYGIVEGQNKTCWMDRNLGALRVATAFDDADAYGDLFQWGRLDDGHQNRDSGLTSTLSSGDNPGHSNFITISDSPYDWRNPQNDNLWQGVGGINNPCPDGWRIPTEAELEAELATWSPKNIAGAIASLLKLPASGYRSRVDGALSNVGSNGLYWSSTVDGTRARYLNFSGSDASMYSNNRANGFSVRCLKD